MTQPLRPADCRYCGSMIVWGTLQNGRDRCFDKQPIPIVEVAPRDQYAYSRRLRAVVCLDGEARPPALVLRAHRCRE